MLNRPHEYGTHWDGLGKRYAIRLSGVATGNAIEASLGALWGEDPRYRRVPDRPFGARVKHVVIPPSWRLMPTGDGIPLMRGWRATWGTTTSPMPGA